MAVVLDPRDGNYYSVQTFLDQSGRLRIVPGSKKSLPLQQAGVLPVEPGPKPEVLRRMLAGLPQRLSPDQLRAEAAQGENVSQPRLTRVFDGAEPNNQGNSVVFFLGTVDQQLFDTVVETPKKNQGSAAEVLTVTLGMSYQNNDQYAADNIQPAITGTALLTWGIGGAIFTAECDWLKGTTFALVASYVRVGLFVVAQTEATPQNVTFSAGIAYGNHARQMASPLRKSVSVGTIVPFPGASALISIPKWANSFTVIANPATAGPLKVSVQSPGANTPGYNVAAFTNSQEFNENFFPIPNGSKQIGIVNNGATDATNVNVIFTLAI